MHIAGKVQTTCFFSTQQAAIMSDSDKKSDEFRSEIQSMFRNLNAGNIFSTFGQAEAQGEPEEPDFDEDNEFLQRIREFNLRPREVRDYLDRFVIKQQEAKKVLSVAICDHYNHVRECLAKPNREEEEYTKQNILLLGPTGVGKTYLMRCIAKLIGVPFVKADATKFSETGYVGHDVDDIVRDLIRVADNDLELAQYGIVYVDEIDKIATKKSGGNRDVSGRGVQINLLKLMEDTEVSIQSQTDLAGQMEAMMEMMHGGNKKKRTINTRHILFIVSGAFDGLAEQVKKRVQGGQIGFGHTQQELDDTAYLKEVHSKDLIDYGFEPEFVGRLPVREVCEPLSADDLEAVLLRSEGSILSQYRSDFTGYGIDFAMAPEAITRIAELASKEDTGARGLMTILERLFRDYKFELPSTPIQLFEISAETIDDPTTSLRELLHGNQDAQRKVLRDEVDAFAARFKDEVGLELEFEEAAIDKLVDLSIETDKTMRAICFEKFHDFKYGLPLIAKSSDTKKFVIAVAVIDNPDEELSRWVVESFKKRDAESADAEPE